MIIKQKNDLDINKLYTSILTALRSYEELLISEENKFLIEKNANISIREAEYNLKLITDSIPALINYIDIEKRIKFNNKVHEEWFEKPTEVIYDSMLSEIIDVPAYEAFIQRWQTVTQGVPVDFDTQLTHAKLGLRDVHVALIPHFFNGVVNGCFCLINDITDRKQSEEKLNFLATHDTLTNTTNRRYFDICLTKAMNEAALKGNCLALLFMDLNKFKFINDQYGHEFGDLLLIQIAERIRKNIRKSDVISRFGGDEFVILLNDIPNPEQAIDIAKEIDLALSEPFTVNNIEFKTSASIGISTYPEDGLNKQALIRNADAAMYQIKQVGGNIHYLKFSKDIDNTIINSKAIQQNLVAGLENKQFVIFYQPIINLSNNAIDSIEALIRWDHPVRGLINPDKFVFDAEETGLIVLIGEQIMQTICEQGVILKNLGFPKLRISINLSVQQLLDDNLYPKMVSILKSTGFSPENFEIELTESMLMQNIDLGVTIMNKLRSLGIRISIDDFGTGYSSLSYLKQLPIDAIKLDKSFLSNLNTDPASMTIVSSLSRLSHELGLQIVAEGVENSQQLLFVKEQKYDQVQGFIISPPLSFEELKLFLIKYRNDNEGSS